MLIRIIILFLLATKSLLSYSAADTLHVSGEKRFTLYYDNDFFSATDRYYTQGTRLELVHPGLKHSPFSLLLPGLKNAVNAYGLAAIQDCFTPTSIRRDTILKGDRPFTAYIALAGLRISTDSAAKKKLISELMIGVLGPAAGGRQTQESIHRWLHNIQPLGWQFQLSNDLVINYKLRYEHGLVSYRYADAYAAAELNAGTLYDNAAAAVTIRAGRISDYFSSTGNRLQAYVFLTGRAQAVLYNATIQGGLFNKDLYAIPAASINRMVYKGAGGIVFSYKKLLLEYTKVFITPEIRTGKDHGWGHVNITVLF
jgi:lipid A 3-O-deacylase